MCILTVPILIEGEEARREQCGGSFETKTKGNIATSRCSVFIPSTIKRKTLFEWPESSPQAATTPCGPPQRRSGSANSVETAGETNHTPALPSLALQHFNNCAVKPSALPKGILNDDPLLPIKMAVRTFWALLSPGACAQNLAKGSCHMSS